MIPGPARLCLVGCGRIGLTHLRAVMEAPDRVRHSAIFDVDTSLAASMAERTGGNAHIVPTWQAVLADPAIDAVDLCLPNRQHADMALQALAAGKHVFLEKPMALTVADCNRLIVAARSTDRVLSVMHNRRFNPASRVVKAMLEAGDLGDPVLVTAHGIEGPATVGKGRWLGDGDQGGVGMAQSVHFAYMLEWLFGEVEEVSCLTSRKGIEWMNAEVTAAYLFRFRSGAVGQLSSTFAQEAGRNEHRITVYGGSGQATFVGNQADVLSPRRYGDADWHREEAKTSYISDFTEPLASFGDAVCGRGQPAVSAEEGRAAVALIEAAYRSAREGRLAQPER